MCSVAFEMRGRGGVATGLALILFVIAGCTSGKLQPPESSIEDQVAKALEDAGLPRAEAHASSDQRSAADISESGLRRARALREAGRYEAALDRVERAEANGVVAAPAALLRARIYLDTGRSGPALKALRTVLDADPDNAEAWNARGVALDIAGCPGQARGAYLKAEQLEPDDWRPTNNRALSAMLSGQPNHAATILADLAQRENAPEKVRHNLAIALAGAGRSKEARAVLEDVEAENPVRHNIEVALKLRAEQASPSECGAELREGRHRGG